MADDPVGTLMESPVFWHLDTYTTRAAAEADNGPRSTVFGSLGQGLADDHRRRQRWDSDFFLDHRANEPRARASWLRSLSAEPGKKPVSGGRRAPNLHRYMAAYARHGLQVSDRHSSS
jgi:hypothetical protein